MKPNPIFKLVFIAIIHIIVPRIAYATDPVASAITTNITVAGSTLYSFNVVYTDDGSIDTTTIDSNDVRISGPGGFDSATAFVSSSASGHSATATYSLVPPGGSWNSADNGTYTVVMQANQVTDALGNPVAPGPISTFTVMIPPGTPTPSPTLNACYPNFTTAEGCDALNSLTTGAANTGVGWRSLFLDSSGGFNTGVGGGALVLNNGDSNTAVGAAALLLNTTGAQNTAVGTDTLVFNDSGTGDTAIGSFALMNASGSGNTAVGTNAGEGITSGNDNVCVGRFSGTGITTGSNIITIGPVTGVHGVFGQVDDTTYIANILGATVDVNTAQPVYVDSDGKLGTVLATAGPGPHLPGPATPKATADGQVTLSLKVEQLQATITQQQQQLETLTARLKEQAAQIRKASDQLEVSKLAARVVANKP